MVASWVIMILFDHFYFIFFSSKHRFSIMARGSCFLIIHSSFPRQHWNALSFQTVPFDVCFFSFTVISSFYKIFLTFQIFNNNFKCAVDLFSFFAVILLVAQTSICITLLAVPARVMREGLVTDISVIENHTAVISCPVSGIPQPSIIWFRGESM